MEGMVKWFDDRKGYGFIRPEGGGPDIYVHVSQIMGEYRVLSEGEPVSFDVAEGDKGPMASHVRKLPAPIRH